MAGLRFLAGQSAQVDSALQSAQRAADLAQQLYRGGRSSYLDLLDARRNLARVERSAVQLRGSRAVATVALIRALGGGWTLRERRDLYRSVYDAPPVTGPYEGGAYDTVQIHRWHLIQIFVRRMCAGRNP